MSTTPIASHQTKSRFPEERRLATVLFADVQGFTSLAEQLDFEMVSYLIKGIWERLDEVIESHGGYIDKHLGDGVMAVWGAPYAGDNDAQAAIEAGLDLQRAMADFVGNVNIPGASTLKLRVGINSGLVFAGYVGTKNEYTVIGDTVNVAHRLEESAVAGTVVVGESTSQLVGDEFDFNRLDPVNAKGKAEPIEAFEVIGQSSTPNSGNGTERLQSRMVFRDTEFARIRKFFEQSLHTSSPVMVLVMGEVGMGKTRLLKEFSTAIQAERELLVLSTRIPSQTSRAPYSTWQTLVKKYFDLTDDLSHNEQYLLFEKRIEEFWPGISGQEAAQQIGHLLGLKPGEQPAPNGEERLSFEQAHTKMRELLALLTRSRAIMLVIDDLHWIDRESLQLLGRIIEKEIKPLKLFVLAGARPDFIRENPHWRNNAAVLVLPPLPIEHSMVAEAYPELANLPEQLRSELAARSEGNPYFLEEIVKTLVKSGLETLKNSPEEALAHLHSDMPEAIRATLQARLDNLPRDARTVVQLGSVCGRTFWVGSILAAARTNTGTGTLSSMPPSVIERLVQDGVRQLVRAELIAPLSTGSEYSPTQEYVFKNSFLCDVAYSLIPVRSRSLHHRAVGQWLAGQDMSIAYKLSSAEHFERAGAFVDAAIQYEQAAQIARKNNANSQARALEDSAALAHEKARLMRDSHA